MHTKDFFPIAVSVHRTSAESEALVSVTCIILFSSSFLLTQRERAASWYITKYDVMTNKKEMRSNVIIPTE